MPNWRHKACQIRGSGTEITIAMSKGVENLDSYGNAQWSGGATHKYYYVRTNVPGKQNELIIYS